MKTIYASALLACTFLTPALADDFETKSAIDGVTVFPRGAEIVRVAAFEIPAGEHTIILKDLPADVVAGSLRVEGAAKEPMSISSVDSKRVFVLNTPAIGTDDDERKRIEKEIEGLQDKRAGLDDAIGAAKFRKKVVQGIANRSLRVPEPTDKETSIGEPDWPTLLDLISVQLEKINVEIRNLMVQQRETDRKISKLTKTLISEPPTREQRTEVAVHVSAESARSGKLKVRYQVTNARWSPFYDARLATIGTDQIASLKLVHRADIVQKTGEIWDGVSLKLSTTRPRGASAAPKLAELQVRLLGPVYGAAVSADKLQEAPQIVSQSNSLNKRLDDSALSPVKEKQEIVEVDAQFEAVGFQSVFKIDGRVSVGNTGQVKKVRILSTDYKPDLSVRAAPVLDPTAYLYAAFETKTDAPIMPGRVALYRDGVFTGTGRLPLLAGGQTHKLGFGADDAVRIKRMEVKRSQGETGILTTARQDERTYKITIENHHARDMPVTILDRMPFAVSEEIKVNVMAGSTPPTHKNADDRRGVMAWERALKPGEKSEIIFGYAITWPKDQMIDLAAR